MTPLTKKVTRRSNLPLHGGFGIDKRKRLVVTLIPGTDSTPDLLELRPEGTRHPVTTALVDIYWWRLRCAAGA